MTLEDLKAIKERRPFEPFVIHLADGRGIPVNHPDALAWEGPEAPAVQVVQAGGRRDVVALAAIRSVSPAGTSAGGDGA